jgi:hypothetical protein
MTDSAPQNASGDPTFDDIVQRLNHWRSIQQRLGAPAYDEPTWENGSLNFRNGYVEGFQKWVHWEETGDWSAYIIEPNPKGFINAKQSLKGERATKRSTHVRVAFGRFEDAAKYVIARVGNALRVSLGLPSNFIKWDENGLDPRVRIGDVTPEQLDYMREICVGIRPGLLEQHLRRYFVADSPDAFALPLPSEIPLMNVLPMTLDELDALLTEGMPQDVAPMP